MKDYGVYKPSYDVVPEDPRRRVQHALHIIYKASKVLYKQSRKDNLMHEFDFTENWFDDISVESDCIFVKHSGVEHADMNCTEINSKYQTMRFADEHCEAHYDMAAEIDPTRKIRDMPDVSLNEFAMRPVLIHSQRWDYGTEMESGQIDPWSLVLNNKRVANRLTNYNLFRAKLHIKIVLTGNPFLYGRAIAFYYPFENGIRGLIDPRRRNICRTQQTQLPHIYLDPSSSEAGEMTLPFFWVRDYICLPDGDINKLGKLHINSLTPLRHVNEAPDSFCELQVFAWFEDMQVAAPTQRDLPTLTPQSGEEVDEGNMKGIISGPATSVARAAHILSGISSIAPYAMATEKAASTTAAVAKHFGFSAPPVTKALEPMRPGAFAQVANSTVPATLNKLSLDDKQELSIDPRIAGLGGDDSLNIHNMASREAYLTSLSWTSVLPRSSNLFSSIVTPTLYNRSNDTQELAFPPMAVATLPFRYWTGSVRFRFMIASSSLHKGRLLIQHDPRDAASVPLEGVEYNTAYSKVVDISKERDFTIEIGNTQQYTYMDTLFPERQPRSTVWRNDGGIITNPLGQNGTLNVYVLNPLTAPGDAVQQVHILVFVSAGRDYEVTVPNPYNLNDYDMVQYVPQSGTEATDVKPAFEFISNEDTSPQMYEIQEMSNGLQNLKDINKVFIGETITSFRTVLKRFMKVEQGALNAAGPVMHKITRGMYPMLKGSYSQAPSQSEIGNYAYTNMTIMNWLMMCFAGVRGGARWKVLFATSQDFNALHSYATVDVDDEGNWWRNTSITIPAARRAEFGVDMRSETNTARERNLGTGGVLAHSTVNPVLEFEVPFYSKRRFWSTGDTYSDLGAVDCGWEAGCVNNIATDVAFTTWFATAEDFQLFFWIGMPLMRYVPTLPVQVG